MLLPLDAIAEGAHDPVCVLHHPPADVALVYGLRSLGSSSTFVMRVKAQNPFRFLIGLLPNR
jgi:hypothetical protein